jgi:hypothetical protein
MAEPQLPTACWKCSGSGVRLSYVTPFGGDPVIQPCDRCEGTGWELGSGVVGPGGIQELAHADRPRQEAP